MPLVLAVPIALLLGYLLGSLPSSHWVARRRGLRIHTVSTGIAGAANVYRNVGPGWGVLVFAADAGKGAAAVGVARLFDLPDPLLLLAGGAAILGHWYPVFARFRGGEGLATVVGVGLALSGWIGLVSFAVAVLAVRLLRNVGNGAAVGFMLYLVLSLVLWERPLLMVGVVAMAMVIMVRARIRHHRRRSRHLSSGLTSSNSTPPHRP